MRNPEGWLSTSDGYAAPGGVRVAHRAADVAGLESPWSRAQQRDFARDLEVAHASSSLQRLADVTQVFFTIVPGCSKRRDHCLEVGRIAALLASELGLDARLAEAIGVAHDGGHAPFGHLGEEWLNAQGVPGDHATWGGALAFAEGHSRELAAAVRAHPWSAPSAGFAEAEVVSWADRIAYLADDVRDARAQGLVPQSHGPLGIAPETLKQDLIQSVLRAIRRAGFVCIDQEAARTLGAVRRANWESIYGHPRLHRQRIRLLAAFDEALATLRRSGVPRGAALEQLREAGDRELLTLAGACAHEYDLTARPTTIQEGLPAA